MPRITWSPTAKRDLDGIFDYIGRENHNPAAAEKVVRQIHEKCSAYARQPHMGSVRPDLAPDVRCFPVGSYVVIYRPASDGILVLTIPHGSQDIPTLFRSIFEN